MLKTVIVDDEFYSIILLKELLAEIGGVEVVHTCRDAAAALSYLSANETDIAFVDIHMPEKDGLDMAREMVRLNIETNIVFFTAYDKYAVAAFELNAMDYLLKPVQPERLKKTIERIIRRRSEKFGVRVSGKNNFILRIESLGGFHIYACGIHEKIGEKIYFRTAKAAELLAFLHCHFSQPVSRSLVMEKLYEGGATVKAMRSLHLATHYLKKTLEVYCPACVFQYKNGSFTLDETGIDSDLRKFKDCFLRYQKVDENNIMEWENVVGLYKGEFLAFRDYSWAVQYRIWLERLYIQGLLKMLEYYTEKKDCKKCIDTAERLLDIDPFNEQAYEYFIRNYLAMGDRIQAQKSYEKMKALLRQELGLEPRLEISELLTS